MAHDRLLGHQVFHVLVEHWPVRCTSPLHLSGFPHSNFLRFIRAISNNVTTEIDCQPLYVFNQLMGNTAVGGASTLLMLRVIAIWNRNLFVVVPLVTLSLGQWAILLHSVSTLRVHYVAEVGQCVVGEAPQIFLQVLYLYSEWHFEIMASHCLI